MKLGYTILKEKKCQENQLNQALFGIISHIPVLENMPIAQFAKILCHWAVNIRKIKPLIHSKDTLKEMKHCFENTCIIIKR